jgi:glycosyltransferase involved in cell wall biosynthesis
MPSINLSVIVITKNEARHIADCLKSVAFADEWVVLDSGSSDATCDIAQSLGARVEQTESWPGFGAQKNRALGLAQGDWVLSIDADERVSPELALSIQAALKQEQAGATGNAGYEMSRLSRFCGQWMRHGDWYPDRVVRLFRRTQGRFSNDLVHERLEVEGRIERLAGELLHDTMPTLHDAIEKMNRYSTGRALDKARHGGRGGLGPAMLHGAWAFLRCYLLKRGFLDGRLGFVLAVYVAEGTYYRYLKMYKPQADAA